MILVDENILLFILQGNHSIVSIYKLSYFVFLYIYYLSQIATMYNIFDHRETHLALETKNVCRTWGADEKNIMKRVDYYF